MSDLGRILSLAGLGFGKTNENDVAETSERELKEYGEEGCECCGGGRCTCPGDCPDCNCHGNNDWDESVEEAVGDAAAPLYDLVDAHGAEAVLDELARYLDVDQIEDFVADYRRHRDMDEAAIDEADLDENAFNQAAAAAARAGKSEFEFNGKKYKTKMDKATAHKLDDDVQFESEEEIDESDDAEEISEAPTMDTTQLITLLKNSGLTEEAIKAKLDEWANTPEGVGEVEPTAHGDAYDFAQSVNLSLKRYLDAQDMKVQVTEHTVEDMKALYESKKSKK